MLRVLLMLTWLVPLTSNGLPDDSQFQSSMDPVTFKAGQCHKEGSTLKADPKKGQILLEASCA